MRQRLHDDGLPVKRGAGADPGSPRSGAADGGPSHAQKALAETVPKSIVAPWHVRVAATLVPRRAP